MNNPRRLLEILLIEMLPTVKNALPAHRADLFEGISIACESAAPEISHTAKRTADAIREAEMLQMAFPTLLQK